jgi:hypothetical protein
MRLTLNELNALIESLQTAGNPDLIRVRQAAIFERKGMREHAQREAAGIAASNLPVSRYAFAQAAQGVRKPKRTCDGAILKERFDADAMLAELGL